MVYQSWHKEKRTGYMCTVQGHYDSAELSASRPSLLIPKCTLFITWMNEYQMIVNLVLPDHDEDGQYKSNTKEQHGRPWKEPNGGFVEEQEEGF